MSDIPFKSWWPAMKIKCHVSVTRTWANTSQGMLFQTAIVFAQTVSCYLGGRLHRCTCSVGVAHWRDKLSHRLLEQKSTTKSWWSILSTLQFWISPNKAFELWSCLASATLTSCGCQSKLCMKRSAVFWTYGTKGLRNWSCSGFRTFGVWWNIGYT